MTNSETMQRYQEHLDQQQKDFISNLLTEPPVPCQFKVGDSVTFTNEFGVSFENRTVVGFANDPNDSYGRFIHLADDAYWFPKSPESLQKTETN